MRKMIQRFSALLMAAILLAGLSSAPVFAYETDGEWEYSISNGIARVHKYLGSSATVTLPTEATINGNTYLITETLGSTFYQNETLKEAIIPEDYKKLGGRTFYGCTHLTKVTFQGDVEVGEYCFTQAGANEKKLEAVFGPKVTKIPRSCFAGNSENSYCHITSVTIGKNVTEIASSAFNECYDLKTVNFAADGALEKIDGFAFDHCTSLLDTNGTGVFTLPDTVLETGIGTFTSCESLKNVVLPSGLVKLGQTTFSGCTSLESVTVQSDISSIGSNVFYNTGTNTRGGYTVNIAEGVTKVANSLFNTSASYVSNQYAHISTLNLSSTVKEIGSSAFYNCYDLEDVNFEEASSLETINRNAFENNTSIKIVALPKSVSLIDSHAFSHCDHLEKVSSSRYTGTVNDYAFYEDPSETLFQCYYGSWLDTFAKNKGFQSGYYAPKKTKITKISNAASGVKLKWKKAVGAKEYHIYRKAKDETQWTDVGTSTKRSFVDKTAKNGVLYQYKVAGSVDDLIGTRSAAKTISFLSRAKFSSAKNIKKKSVSLKWKKNTAADGYIIRYANNSSMKKAKTVKITDGSTSKVIKKLRKGEKYYFQLQVYHKEGSTTYKSYWSKKKGIVIKK